MLYSRNLPFPRWKIVIWLNFFALFRLWLNLKNPYKVQIVKNWKFCQKIFLDEQYFSRTAYKCFKLFLWNSSINFNCFRKIALHSRVPNLRLQVCDNLNFWRFDLITTNTGLIFAKHTGQKRPFRYWSVISAKYIKKWASKLFLISWVDNMKLQEVVKDVQSLILILVTEN